MFPQMSLKPFIPKFLFPKTAVVEQQEMVLWTIQVSGFQGVVSEPTA